MKKIKLSVVKNLFLDLLVGAFGGLLFFGTLFVVAEPFMSKCECVYTKGENANLGQNNENKESLVIEEEKEPIQEPVQEPVENSVQEPIPEQPKRVSLGEFKLTAYCSCVKCCGKSDGITATGTKAKEGRTIAVDPSVISYGTVVYIEGVEYVAEDCGGAIKNKRIDVYFDSHQDALDFGVKYAIVEVDVK